jgi:hypothetical protein
MDDEAIRDIISRLDDLRADDAKSNFRKGHPPHWLFAIGNKAGLLNLAKTFLRASIEPIVDGVSGSKSVKIDQQHVQFVQNKNDFQIGFVVRKEDWPSTGDVWTRQNRKARARDRVFMLGCGVIAFVFIFLLVGGVMYWCSLWFGK